MTACSAAALLLGALPTAAHAGFRLGDTVRANTYTTGQQYASDVARDAAGNFVVVWTSAGQDGSGDGIFGQRYAADGRRLGREFAVNTRTTGPQQRPSVAMNATGGFVVAWTDADPEDYDIFVRAFDARGVPRGDEVRANADATGYQQRPDVAIDGDGDFAVIWTGPGSDAVEVFVRRFAADQTPRGDDRRVNKSVTGDQDYASIAMDAAGDFVVTWESYLESEESYKAYFRRFDATGAAKDVEDVPVENTSGGQQEPFVAMNASGGFVIAWGDSAYTVPAPTEYAIHARRFKASGEPRDADALTVATHTANIFPWGVAMDATGDAVIAWRVSTGPTSSDVLFRLLGADSFDSKVLRANANTTKYHEQPAVAMDADGDFVISWNARAAESDDANVLLQRFRYSGPVNLAIRQNDAPDPADGGQTIRYTLRVSNLQATADLGLPAPVQDALGSASGVTVTEHRPEGSTYAYVEATTAWNCDFDVTRVICRLRKPLLAGEQADPVTVGVVAPNDAGTLTHRAVVSADQRDGRPGNNETVEETTVQ